MLKTMTLLPWQIDKSCCHTISHYINAMASSVISWQTTIPSSAPINILPNNKSGIFIFTDNQIKAIIWCDNIVPNLPIDNIIIKQIKTPFRLGELGKNIIEIYDEITQSNEDKGIVELSKQVTLNIARRQLIYTPDSGNPSIIIELTEKETDLLNCLKQCKKSNEKYISRETLLKKVWSYNYDIDTHTIETHIYRLRNKISELNVDLEIRSEDGGYFLR